MMELGSRVVDLIEYVGFDSFCFGDFVLMGWRWRSLASQWTWWVWALAVCIRVWQGTVSCCIKRFIICISLTSFQRVLSPLSQIPDLVVFLDLVVFRLWLEAFWVGRTWQVVFPSSFHHPYIANIALQTFVFGLWVLFTSPSVLVRCVCVRVRVGG